MNFAYTIRNSAFIAFAILFVYLISQTTFAQSVTSTLGGYAWSSTIGWLQMSGVASDSSIYGVNLDSSSNLSGYAWSSTIGWVKFGSLSGCPATSNCDARIVSGGELSGWARACTVFQSGCSGALKPDTATGGWDGWISLNCNNTLSCGTSNYRWKLTGSTISGYAWGGSVVGWLYADNIDLGLSPATVNIGVRTLGSSNPFTYTSPYPLSDGEEIEVGWDSADAYECFSTQGSGFSTSAQLNGVDDTVSEPASGSTETFTIFCRGIAGDGADSITVEYPVSQVSIWTEPIITELNNTVMIYWDVTGNDPAACSISGPNGFGMTLIAGEESGSVSSDPIEGESDYTITCAANGINPAANNAVKVRVNASSVES